MGRHSRPEDVETPDEAGQPDDPHASPGGDDSAGRHSPTYGQPGTWAPSPVPPGPAQPARPEPGEPHRRHGTAADVRLIRERADVRNRCAAAVLVPFIVYTFALLLLGRLDIYLIWVFAPTIAAGLLVGAILDHAHKRYPEG